MVARYKITHRNQYHRIFKQATEGKVEEMTPCTLSTKIKNILGMNLTRNMQNLYEKNFKNFPERHKIGT